MKKKIIAMLIVLVMAVSALPFCAFAEEDVAPASLYTGEHGWTTPTGYAFYIGGNIYNIPYGTVCSQTYNSSVYEYVFPVQYVLSDLADHHSNNGYDPYGTDGLFGPNTASAVRYYQGRKGLTVDGCVGDNTWSSFVTQWTFGAA